MIDTSQANTVTTNNQLKNGSKQQVLPTLKITVNETPLSIFKI